LGGELFVEAVLLSGREDPHRVALALASLGAGRSSSLRIFSRVSEGRAKA
jgi:hypothetical protein